jgi:hypothetical protein
MRRWGFCKSLRIVSEQKFMNRKCDPTRIKGFQMSTMMQGYVRADVPLTILDTSVHKRSTSPLTGLLEISTEDGVLRLAISGDAAKDLKIDLGQFLAQE